MSTSSPVALRARFACPFVLVTGGKGGVGKTTLATNLALSLVAAEQRVLLVDLDLGLANVDVMLDLAPRGDLERALDGHASFADCVVEGPDGLHVLPASNGSAHMAQLDSARRARLLEGVAELSRDYDLILADSAAGIGADVLAFGASAHVVLLVTTPDPAAATDAYGLIKALESAAHDAQVEMPTPELVLNQVTGLVEAESTAARLADVCRRFLARSPRLAGWLPRSARIADAARRRTTFARATTKGGAPTLERECLERLARRVLQACGLPWESQRSRILAAQGSRNP
ncbi:MAG: AAA family ATPase [Planctomycetes bacterium]|nr:AAA family ATPase [Planctomycetota bacterium]